MAGFLSLDTMASQIFLWAYFGQSFMSLALNGKVASRREGHCLIYLIEVGDACSGIMTIINCLLAAGIEKSQVKLVFAFLDRASGL